MNDFAYTWFPRIMLTLVVIAILAPGIGSSLVRLAFLTLVVGPDHWLRLDMIGPATTDALVDALIY